MEEFDVTGELSEDCKVLEITHHQALRRLISGMRGKVLRIRFSILHNKRSDAQNRYIWGVVVPTVRAWLKETQGEVWTKDQVYSWLRIGVLGEKPEISEIMGHEVITMTGKRFSKMNTKEFAEAIDLILQKMAEKGCVIPEPRQHNFLTDFLKDD